MNRRVGRGLVGGWAIALVAVGTVGLLHCSSSSAAPESDSQAQAESEALSTPDAVKLDAGNVSFLVTSDLHFGYEAGVLQSGVDGGDEDDVTNEGDLATDDRGNPITILQKNRELAVAMMAAKGDAATATLRANGIRNDFKGVIVTGDIADNGQEEQWAQFYRTFDPPAFDMNVYETSGNHDYPWTKSTAIPANGNKVFDISRINHRTVEEHRPNVFRWDGDKKSTDSEESGSYAWKWDDSDVVFINLGLKVSRYDDGGITRQGYLRHTDPFDSLHFLKGVLAEVGNDTPVVLSFHYPMNSSDERMDKTERQELRDALVGHRISAILHGHRHQASLYSWCGVPVFEVDTPRNAGPGVESSFVAVTIEHDTIAAQTISYQYVDGSDPLVTYDAVTSSTTPKDLKAFCTGRKNDLTPCWYYPRHALAAAVSKDCDVQATKELDGD